MSDSSKLYTLWQNIKKRVRATSGKHTDYLHIQGQICAEWLNDFSAFRKWAVNAGWRGGLEIDRINNSKGYFPNNCRFVTKRENRANTRLLRKSNVSGYRGVAPHGKEGSRWRVQFNVLGDRTCLGLFSCPRDAALARDIYSIKHMHGTPLNFPELLHNSPI